MQKRLLIIYCLMLACTGLVAQTQVDILNAESLKGTKTTKTLVGNVQLRHKDATLICDSALLGNDDKKVDAYGHVHIIQNDTINIYGDVLHYDATTRKAILVNHVRMLNGKSKLETDKLDYDMSTKVASYNNGAVLTNGDTRLTSDKGHFFNTTQDVFFRYHVKLVNPRYHLTADTLRFNANTKIAYFLGPTNISNDTTHIYCESGFYNTSTDDALFTQNALLKNKGKRVTADSIFYFSKQRMSLGLHNVNVYDSIQQTRVKAQHIVFFEDSDRVTATQKPLLITQVEKDSLFLAADTLYSHLTKDSVRLFSAYHHVKLFKSNMQAVCDSMTFSTHDSTFHLYKNPVVWLDSTQMKADTVNVILKNKKVDHIYMNVKATIIKRCDTGLYNQIAGKTVVGYFTDNELSKITVNGNAEMIYYPKNDSGAYMGADKAVSSKIVIEMDKNTIKRIYTVDAPHGHGQPVKGLNTLNMIVHNFIWLDDKRPVSIEDLLK